MPILTINGGSSSVKFALFENLDAPRRVAGGEVSRIDSARHIVDWLDRQTTAPRAIVHRVVHGGDRFTETTALTPDVLEALRGLVPMAPNHLPSEIDLIEAFARARPAVPQFACFDTAFHRTLPPVSRTIALPAAPGLRRYGFHGISYTYLLGALAEAAGDRIARGRVILAHLGSGASLAAVRDGACIDTTMGMTPTGGIPMSTRSGDVDPGALVYLARQRGWSIDDLAAGVTQRAGLAAISGGDADMRSLLARAADDARARLAVEVFAYAVRTTIGAFAAALGGLDALVFAGGIGEHAPEIRRRACADLAFLGLDLSADANAASAPVISSPGSRVSVRVIPTDEAIVMARETAARLTRGA